MPVELISSDVFNNVIAYLIIIPFVASMFLTLFFERDDEMLHVYRMACYLVGCISSLYLGFEALALNIYDGNVQLDVTGLGLILIAWAIVLALFFVVSLKSLVYDGLEEADRGSEL